MEWLTLLKELSDQADQTAMQQQIETIARQVEANRAMIDALDRGAYVMYIGLFAIIIVGVALLLWYIGSVEKRIKKTEQKLEKLIPLIEQAAGVKVV